MTGSAATEDGARLAITDRKKDVIITGGRGRMRLGPIGTVVASAGIAPYGELLDLGVDRWRRILDINLTGACAVTTESARRMVEAGIRGAVCCIPSGAGSLGRVGAGRTARRRPLSTCSCGCWPWSWGRTASASTP
ncbi:short chain dehydrogenase [Pseudonocardia thermophila]|uniref:Short chain dehydrogenase n=1 Tax=Pseudonocardia thermophila TaxID=1848 RepID=A0A1M6V4K1_PSETH|nr:SDR family NAD(P)-dependent oxidoreductase [Pseudonocardia thermophila]SHK76226.1 short chain dehydrogenase [Pseudonocardia thermophila]